MRARVVLVVPYDALTCARRVPDPCLGRLHQRLLLLQNLVYYCSTVVSQGALCLLEHP